MIIQETRARASRAPFVMSVMALIVAIGSVGGPAVASVLFAQNAHKVDGKHAVGAGASSSVRAGKLVATGSTGRLPNNIISTAPNSAKVGGLTASQLRPRVSFNENAGVINDFDTCGFTDMISTTIAAPTSGFLVITGQVSGARDADDPDPSELRALTVVDAKPATTSPTRGVRLISQDTDEGDATVIDVQPVAAGSHTVVLKASECSAGVAFISGRTITVLFVPLGSVSGARQSARAAANR